MVRQLIVRTLCPLCQSPLQDVGATTFDPVVRNGQQRADKDFDQRPRETTIAACTGCEFIVDLKQSDGSHKSSAQLLHEVGQWLCH